MPARLIAATVVATLTAAWPAGATAPAAGVLVPGQSLGGVGIGWTTAQVTRAWGTTFGRCRNCGVKTRYYNRVPFRPEGAAVELRRGRVSAVFTLWAPKEWHTDRNVYVGEPERRVTTMHGTVRRIGCPGYEGLVLRSPGGARSVVYVVDGKVWGFALLDGRAQVCR